LYFLKEVALAKIKTGPKVKRKGGGVPAKTRAVDALAEQLSASTSLIITEYRGLKVTEFQDLRKRLRPKGVEYHVVKNSLFARAATKTLRIIGGLIGGQSYSAEDITALSKLPGRAYLQAQIVGSIQAPLGQITNLLNAPFATLVHVLTARAQ
jgi:large subunit ribosomal protein L10